MILKKEIKIHKDYKIGHRGHIANWILKRSNNKVYLCLDRMIYENKKDEEIVNTIEYYMDLLDSNEPSSELYKIHNISFLEDGKYFPKFKVLQHFSNEFFNYSLIEIDSKKTLNFFISAGFFDSVMHIFSSHFSLLHIEDMIRSLMNILAYDYIDNTFFDQFEKYFKNDAFVLFDMLDGMDSEGYLCVTRGVDNN